MKLRKNYKSDGKIKTLHQWSKIKGIPYCDLLSEIRMHGDIEKAFKAFQPPVTVEPSEDSTVKGKTIAHDGKDLTLDEWTTLTGTKKATLRSRIKRGWDLARVFAKKGANK
jgi:hypothetical protein